MGGDESVLGLLEFLSISDLTGCAVLRLDPDTDIVEHIHRYLHFVYADGGRATRRLPAPELPRAETNMLSALCSRPRMEVDLRPGPFGDCLTIDTWGGRVLDLGWDLLSSASFRLVLRGFRFL